MQVSYEKQLDKLIWCTWLNIIIIIITIIIIIIIIIINKALLLQSTMNWQEMK